MDEHQQHPVLQLFFYNFKELLIILHKMSQPVYLKDLIQYIYLKCRKALMYSNLLSFGFIFYLFTFKIETLSDVNILVSFPDNPFSILAILDFG